MNLYDDPTNSSERHHKHKPRCCTIYDGIARFNSLARILQATGRFAINLLPSGYWSKLTGPANRYLEFLSFFLPSPLNRHEIKPMPDSLSPHFTYVLLSYLTHWLSLSFTGYPCPERQFPFSLSFPRSLSPAISLTNLLI
jgi:hypothetical protein